ncbi:MAG: insulinase family protein [Candidatus Melainabacteria bacterium]|nr:MAG: insulinase family protein [Candidatus Melainabacteria bacterium]
MKNILSSVMAAAILFYASGATALAQANESSQLPGGVKLVATDEKYGISEYKLASNDLQILLLERHSLPVLLCNMVYHVGSRNEAVGYTGSTHFLEHMLFKGTLAHDPLQKTGIDDILKTVGGVNNATTSRDRTNYYELVPANQLDLALDIESDRMRNALIRDPDRRSEMTVVRNELEIGDDSPDELLDNGLYATAFKEHPYHHPVIGWRSDVENVPTERLRKFYQDFYWPNNATLILVGDFNKDEALKKIDKYFSVIPKSEKPIGDIYTFEPKQEGERRFVIKRGAETPRMVLGFRAPQAVHDDQFAIGIIESVLGNSAKRSSRLYKALIDTGLANYVGAYTSTYKDPGLFVVSAQANVGADLKVLESVINKELDRLKKEPITKEELDRAKKSIVNGILTGMDDPMSLCFQFTEAVGFGSWKFWVDYPKNIEKVTVEEVQKAAQKYFVQDSSTVGYYYPKPETKEAVEKAPEPVASVETPSKPEVKTGTISGVDNTNVPKPALEPSQINIGKRTIKFKLDNGLSVLVLPLEGAKTVAISGKIAAGNQFATDEKRQVPAFLADILTAGTKNRSKEEIATSMEEIGVNLDFSASTFFDEFDVQVVASNLDKFIDVLADVIENPTVPKSELDLLKKMQESNLLDRMADTADNAWNSFVRKLYTPESGLYQRTFEEQLIDLKKISVADLKAFHKNYYTPANSCLAFVGAIDEAKARSLCQKYFGNWKNDGGKTVRDQVKVDEKWLKPITQNEEVKTDIPGKSNLNIRVGKILPVSIHSENYFPTLIANAALGYDSFACRLAPVRDKYGLTYGIYSVIDEPIVKNGPWLIKYSVNPTNLNKARTIVKDIVSDYVKGGITDGELANEKSHLSGELMVSMRSPSRLADRLTLYEMAGVNPSYIDQFSPNLYKVTKEEVNKAISQYMDISKDTVTTISGELTKVK